MRQHYSSSHAAMKPVSRAGYAFTQNARSVNLLGEQIESGMPGINSFMIAMPEAPFGGVKESGHGSEPNSLLSRRASAVDLLPGAVLRSVKFVGTTDSRPIAV
jgi:acyl-CoA reductase-like NAD-dependent aldehyde dehydrogenase